MTSHKTVTKAAGLMMVAIAASRFLGLIREMLIARQFGQTGEVGAYSVAFNLPDLLYFFLSSGALSGAFIPVFTERLQKGKNKEAWQIFSIIACFMGLVLTAAIVASEIFAEPLVKIFAAPGYAKNNPELIPLVVKLTRIILPCQLFFFMGGLMMGTLESRQKFNARAAGPVIYNLGIIFGAVILSRWFSVAGLAWGAMIGSFVGNIGYTFYCMKKAGFEFHPSLNIRHPGVKKVGALALPVILGLSLPQIDVIINRWFATWVSPSGPAALNFANRLMQVPLGIFAQAAGTAILPTLSMYAAQRAFGEMRSAVSFGLRAILAINIPASIYMVIMADPITRAVYMSGRFTSADIGDTSTALVFYSVGLFAWAGQAIVARGFFAMQDTITPVVLGTIATIIFIPLNFILMKIIGLGGLAFATSIAAAIHLAGLTWFLRGKIGGIEGRKILDSLWRVCAASFVMGAVCIAILYGIARYASTPFLLVGEIRNPVEMTKLLKSPSSPIAYEISNKLSTETKELANNLPLDEEGLYRLQTSLTHDINSSIKNDKLYSLMPGALQSGKSNLTLNRLALEQAFPDLIVKRKSFDVGNRKTALLTIVITMAIASFVYIALLKLLRVEEVNFVWDLIRKRFSRRRNGNCNIEDVDKVDK